MKRYAICGYEIGQISCYWGEGSDTLAEATADREAYLAKATTEGRTISLAIYHRGCLVAANKGNG